VTTDSTGRAVVRELLEVGQTYVIEEVAVPAGLSIALPVQKPVLIERSHQRFVFENTVDAGTPGW
jgi:hypothetical protein